MSTDQLKAIEQNLVDALGTVRELLAVPTPPVVGAYDAFGTTELLAKMASATGGETITAKSGYAYEGFTITGINPVSEVTIVGEDGARFGQIMISKSSQLRISASFLLDAPPVLTSATPYFVRALPDTSEIVVQSSQFFSRVDADAYTTWDLATWQTWRMGGALLDGPDSAVVGCLGIGLNAGFSVGGVRSRILGNVLRGVSRDAYRLTADFCAAEDNSVEDMISLGDGNHPDMLQCFEAGDGRLSGLRILRNDLRALVNIQGNPLAATAQGIGGYGSPKAGGGSINTTFDDLIVEDNHVEATAWNGINLTIVQDGAVRRNTVIDPYGRTDGHARLRITGLCANTFVEDNRAPRLVIAAAATQGGNIQV